MYLFIYTWFIGLLVLSPHMHAFYSHVDCKSTAVVRFSNAALCRVDNKKAVASISFYDANIKVSLVKNKISRFTLSELLQAKQIHVD